MRKPFIFPTLIMACFIFFLCPSKGFGQRTPIPPGVREADKETNAPIEPPAKFKQKPADPALVKQEAEELARLSAAIPSQVEQVGHGQFPKDLADQLKRIEKLANHLRSEISH